MWINKTFTKIPESLIFVFNPNMNCRNITVNKLNENVDIQNVVVNGTYHLHGVNPDLYYDMVMCNFNNGNSEYDNRIMFESIDSGLSIFVPNGFNEYTTFPTPLNMTSDLSKGIGFVGFDNQWNTNYPLWYPFDEQDINSTFRFNVFINDSVFLL